MAALWALRHSPSAPSTALPVRKCWLHINWLSLPPAMLGHRLPNYKSCSFGNALSSLWEWPMCHVKKGLPLFRESVVSETKLRHKRHILLLRNPIGWGIWIGAVLCFHALIYSSISLLAPDSEWAVVVAATGGLFYPIFRAWEMYRQNNAINETLKKFTIAVIIKIFANEDKII